MHRSKRAKLVKTRNGKFDETIGPQGASHFRSTTDRANFAHTVGPAENRHRPEHPHRP